MQRPAAGFDLSDYNPALREIAIPLAGAAELWAAILGTIAKASLELHAQVLEAVSATPASAGPRFVALPRIAYSPN